MLQIKSLFTNKQNCCETLRTLTHSISDNHMMFVVLSIWKVLPSNEHKRNNRVCGDIRK